MQKRRMGLQHVEAFRAVALMGSMSSAAQHLHTSQPQVSRLIGQLEGLVHFALFDRSRGRLTLTPEGHRFFREVEKAFIGLDALETAASGIHSFSSERLRVAAMPRLASGLLTRIIAEFLRDHPNVAVSIRSGTSSAVHDWIATGLCDVGIAMLYNEPTGVQIEPILTRDCVAIMPKGHHLSVCEFLSPKDFTDLPYVASPAESPLAQRVDQVFNAAGVVRSVVVETDLGASVCALVGAGLGLSLINPLAAQEERLAAGLEIRPFSPSIPTTIAIVHPPYVPRSRLVATFDDYARRAVKAEFADLGISTKNAPGST
ncbi:DNA-binding transcriptional LysR family regulator [Bradyrhizobium sp. GM5.1]